MSFLECQPAYVVCCKNSCVISYLLNKELSEIIYISVFLFKKSISHGRPGFLMWILLQESLMHPVLFCQYIKKPDMREIGSILCFILNIRDLETLEEKCNTKLILSFCNKSTPVSMIFCKCVPNTGTTQASNPPML